MTPLLSMRGIDAGYGGARILHGLNIEIKPGESVAILGRNGVGKTTCVKTFLGVAKLFSGEVAFSGRPVKSIKHYDAARAGISVVLQGRGILPNLTVQENLILGGAVQRKGRWSLEPVFDLFPILRERAATSGTALSGGQQQMLAIGRALMANPALLVLDEPSEGLAPVIIDELADIFRRLHNDGTSLLLIEQNYSLVSRVSDRYHVLSKGSVVDEGELAGLSMESLKKHVAV
jgi:branched-chain amino acid transport system ATP-binding protein